MFQCPHTLEQQTIAQHEEQFNQGAKMTISELYPEDKLEGWLLYETPFSPLIECLIYILFSCLSSVISSGLIQVIHNKQRPKMKCSAFKSCDEEL